MSGGSKVLASLLVANLLFGSVACDKNAQKDAQRSDPSDAQTAGCGALPATQVLFPLHAQTPCDRLLHRKNVKNLTAEEKANFIAAILKLKSLPSPTGYGVGNFYDYFVARHMSKTVCWTSESGQGGWGHNGPDLLTFHRAFLLDFEETLQVVSGKPITIPYWDWTDPASTSAMFADDMMGPSGMASDNYIVKSGPFRQGQWAVNVQVWNNPAPFPSLVRAVGVGQGKDPNPPTAQKVEFALGRPVYDVSPYDPTADENQSFRSAMDVGASANTCDTGVLSNDKFTDVDRPHFKGHLWIGGSFELNGQMVEGTEANVSTSPNDPIFWLHHANLDRIAEQWWAAHNRQYLPTSGGPRGDNINDPVWFYAPLVNGDMAQPTQTFGYTYDAPNI